MRCLVTGATGYVGGRLVPRLLAAGHEVRCLTRDARRLRDVPWARRVEITEGDVLEDTGLPDALRGVEVAYYLVHAQGGEDFEDADRLSALNFAIAAEAAGVDRIVHLGGPLLREVGDIFLRCAVPATVFRAGLIIGSGSASFELLRHLAERHPAMLAPAWMRTRVQPIAIRDVLRYLVSAATVFPPPVNRAFDIGGPDVRTFDELLQGYSRIAGLPRRVLVPVAAAAPALSSHWIGLVTPLPGRVARPLVGGLCRAAVCAEHDIAGYVPDPHDGLTGFDAAVRLALRRIRDADVETHWSGAAPSDPLPSDPRWSGATAYRDERAHYVDGTPQGLWLAIEDTVDAAHRHTWAVEQVVPEEVVRLRLQRRIPGQAWLELWCAVDEEERTVYEQRVVFRPQGLAGHLYWRAVAPLHRWVFGRMATAVVRRVPAPVAASSRGSRPRRG
ncbi:DUF2867 domain-containing protein [Dactylosporangium vinaceum]|uniref:DUF2867 domain-containing protein n=1 Tax=Dactylosporangium vinaceum TaxID=53362 RepID=A0ABV5M6M1_9ACTN|nr:DUF2867 domain-containing protein [Dactylosporangium vinaceum]UAB97912.1 DUF2867 domain-containing protein [Dactylosporangium vinaceum]